MSITVTIPKTRAYTERVTELQWQRTVMRHLLHENELTMDEALSALGPDDQVWLADVILRDAQEKLFLAGHITDQEWRKRFWSEYNHLLSHLFEWVGHSRSSWSDTHGELLAMLRMIVRRYKPWDINADQLEAVQRVTQRLHTVQLHMSDMLTVAQMLDDMGLQTRLDLSPVATELFDSYVDELGRGK